MDNPKVIDKLDTFSVTLCEIMMRRLISMLIFFLLLDQFETPMFIYSILTSDEKNYVHTSSI